MKFVIFVALSLFFLSTFAQDNLVINEGGQLNTYRILGQAVPNEVMSWILPGDLTGNPIGGAIRVHLNKTSDVVLTSYDHTTGDAYLADLTGKIIGVNDESRPNSAWGYKRASLPAGDYFIIMRTPRRSDFKAAIGYVVSNGGAPELIPVQGRYMITKQTEVSSGRQLGTLNSSFELTLDDNCMMTENKWFDCFKIQMLDRGLLTSSLQPPSSFWVGKGYLYPDFRYENTIPCKAPGLGVELYPRVTFYMNRLRLSIIYVETTWPNGHTTTVKLEVQKL